jgi:hypothetical protein
MKSLIFALVAAAGFATPSLAATVNLDGVANASLDGSNAASVALGAGTYKLTFTQDAFTAFSRFSGQSGCDGSGGNCSQGFENSARYIIGGTTYLFGDGAGSGGIGPVSGGAYYDTAAHSFANSGKYSALFTLAAPSNVKFFIYDDYLGDNRGGISLSVAGVPEPATWGLMILGFGAVGFAARRRKSSVRPVVA